ncbi:MAG TPA: PIG-L deacetylase family protein [Chitinophagaceae bacterium]
MKKRILILAPHTDDGELGCGGSIARYAEETPDVFYLAASTCRRSLPHDWPPDTLETEVRNATRILGVPEQNLLLLDYDVRRFKETRQQILEDLIRFRDDIQPDLVFVPSPTDIHQDHQVISEEGLRAFKNTSILGYEMPWNNVTFNTRAFIKLEKRHIDKKVEALQCYKSQLHRSYVNESFVHSLATVRGVQMGAQFAEAFEVVRYII